MDEWEYDPCDDCTADGDDYYTDENGEMQSSCYDCPFYNKNEEYIKIAEAGKALLELNVYYDYVMTGNPPDKIQKKVQELKDKMNDIK